MADIYTEAQFLSRLSGAQPETIFLRDLLSTVFSAVGVHTNVAPAGQTQAAATQLNYGLSIVNAPGLTDTGLQLPLAVPGARVTIFPKGNHSSIVYIWAKSGSADTINGEANSAAFVAISITAPSVFVCETAGLWLTNAQAD